MKQTTKEAMLARIRAAIANAPEAPAIPDDFRQYDERDHSAIQADFVDRLLDYKASVVQVDVLNLPQSIADACQSYSIQRLVIPADIPSAWLPAAVTMLPDDPPLSLADIDGCDGVLTGCAQAIAQTGTILLDGGAAQGRRLLSLVPDQHICIVRSSQIVGIVPEAIAAMRERSRQPITLISGPSATSDIELSRVEGVHGPRRLHVIIVQDLT
jgi:L-lactate dehydrogenase complex protein LldG